MQASDVHDRQYAGEKIEPQVERVASPDNVMKAEILEDDGEVFKSHTGQADFRVLGW